MFNREKNIPQSSLSHTYQLTVQFGTHAPIMIYPQFVYNTQPKAGVT